MVQSSITDLDITDLTTEKLARDGIRFVAQEKKVFTNLSVKENLELASFATGVKLNDAVDMAIQLYPRFADLLNSKAGHLSGGQKEVLLILRALLGKPQLLLIDEPTEGLASIVIEDIFKLLELMKGEVSAIIVEQNLNLVSKLADTVYLMREGHIVKEITNHEIDNIDELETYL
jgi:ABC-type branched-subunit amino acid transport system ATPase component